MKKVTEAKIRGFILHQLQGVHKVESCRIHFLWIEKDKRRDLDNIAFAKKFILDALVGANVLKGDGWSCVKGFKDSFSVDKYRPRIEVYIDECVEEE